MEKVYKNGFCNLASSLAATPEEGLFWDRNPTLDEPFTIEMGTAASVAYFKVALTLQTLIRQCSPLYKRGWVVQEMYLSPRTIHFSRYPAFECREEFIRESQRRLGTLGGPLNVWPGSAEKLNVYGDPLSYGEWHRIVSFYSRCNLTQPTDKLVAFRGLSSALSSRESGVFGGIWMGPYFGGIWKKWWLEGLLWQVDQYNWPGGEMPAQRWKHEYIGE